MALAFVSPWLLVGLAALPVLWWLLRLTPPAPKRIPFPAIRLLFGLLPKEETPHRTPWWLILLRLAIAALLIVGLSHPLWNAAQPFARSGPLMLVLDDGWASGPGWGERQAFGQELIAEADREKRGRHAADHGARSPTACCGRSRCSRRTRRRRKLAALQPSPWPVDRAKALELLNAADFAKDLNTVWLGDGLADAKPENDRALHDALTQARPGDRSWMTGRARCRSCCRSRSSRPQGITLRATRAVAGAPQRINVRVLDRDNQQPRPGDRGLQADRISRRDGECRSADRAAEPRQPAGAGRRPSRRARSRCWTIPAGASRSASSPTTRPSAASRCWASFTTFNAL